MKKLNNITAYELYMYALFDDMKVDFIQFDKTINWYPVRTNQTLENLYNEWIENNREDCLFTALIKWFNVEDNKLTICLYGTDGKNHYEE